MVCRAFLSNIYCKDLMCSYNDELCILFKYVSFKANLAIIPLAVITGFIISVFLYYLFIKFTPFNWLINGYSKSPLKIKLLGS